MRVGAAIVALAVAALVAQTGLGFVLAKTNPALGVRIAPHNAAALTAAAEARMLSAQDDADIAAVDHFARAAVLASPLEATSLRNIGFIQAVNGKDAQAEKTIAFAAQASKRDYLSHAWLLDRRFQQNRGDLAIEQADIVLRQKVSVWPAVLPALVRLVGEPRIMQPLVKTLAGRPYWRASFLEILGRTGENKAATFDLLSRLRRLGAGPSTAEQRTYFTSQIQATDAATLFRRWQALLPAPLPAGQQLLRDGDFHGLDVPPPFTWNFFPREGTYAEISAAPAGAGKALYLSFDGTAQVNFISQALMLRPGSYRLAGRGFADDAASASKFRWSLRCGIADSGREIAAGPITPTVGRWSPIAFDFTVPAECVGQTIWVTGLAGETLAPATLWLDALTLQPRAGVSPA